MGGIINGHTIIEVRRTIHTLAVCIDAAINVHFERAFAEALTDKREV